MTGLKKSKSPWQP